MTDEHYNGMNIASYFNGLENKLINCASEVIFFIKG